MGEVIPDAGEDGLGLGATGKDGATMISSSNCFCFLITISCANLFVLRVLLI